MTSTHSLLAEKSSPIHHVLACQIGLLTIVREPGDSDGITAIYKHDAGICNACCGKCLLNECNSHLAFK